MTVGVYDHCHTIWNGCPANASNKCARLSSDPPDADGISLCSNSSVAYINIIIAGGEIFTGFDAYRDIAAAGGVFKQRTRTIGRVAVAGGVIKERGQTGRCVVEADRVAIERISTGRSVKAAGGITVTECEITVGCVLGARC